MMKTALIAATGALALGGTAGIAQEAEKKEEKGVERIVVINDEKGGGQADEQHVIRTRRHSGPEGVRHVVLADCEGDKTEVEAGDDKDRTRIILCGKPGMSAEERIKKLEEMRDRLASREPLDEAHRARMREAFDRAIARLRSAD